MGTRRSRHNKGRKPIYKEHRLAGAEFFAHSINGTAAPVEPFWLCDIAKGLTSNRARSLSEDLAFELFKSIRWSKSAGDPQCPHCGSAEAYERRRRQNWKCKPCGSDFSATSGTIFAARKLSYVDLLLAIINLAGVDKAKNASKAAAEIGCTIKSANAIAIKMRDEARVREESFAIGKPRYIDGRWLSTRTWWTDAEKTALKAFITDDRANPTQAAYALGRSPTSIAHYARDSGIILPSDWSKLITKRGVSEPRFTISYPYIIKARPEHADVLEINNLIPKSIPTDMRADMCQEIMLAVLEGRMTMQQLRQRSNSAAFFIKKSIATISNRAGTPYHSTIWRKTGARSMRLRPASPRANGMKAK